MSVILPMAIFGAALAIAGLYFATKEREANKNQAQTPLIDLKRGPTPTDLGPAASIPGNQQAPTTVGPAPSQALPGVRLTPQL